MNAVEVPPEDVSDRHAPARDVFVGRHSSVWQTLSRCTAIAPPRVQAIGHEDVGTFGFTSADRVWVLSYSRSPDANRALLDKLSRRLVREIVYVSSSSTIVAAVTACYEYPRVKLRAELDALALPATTRVLTIGMMYESELQLPGGRNVATSYAELAKFVAMPEWPEEGGRRKCLFRVVERPFGSSLERWAYWAYAQLMRLLASRPCILRPLDLILRALGVRWYGYVHLSNRLWTSTTS